MSLPLNPWVRVVLAKILRTKYISSSECLVYAFFAMSAQVFPAHGAGSPCGKNISKDLYSTIGKEKATNPALSYTNVREIQPSHSLVG